MRLVRLVRERDDERERVVLDGPATAAPAGGSLRRRRRGDVEGLQDDLFQPFNVSCFIAALSEPM